MHGEMSDLTDNIEYAIDAGSDYGVKASDIALIQIAMHLREISNSLKQIAISGIPEHLPEFVKKMPPNPS